MGGAQLVAPEMAVAINCDPPSGRDGVPSPSGLPEASNVIESGGGFVNAPVGMSKR